MDSQPVPMTTSKYSCLKKYSRRSVIFWNRPVKIANRGVRAVIPTAEPNQTQARKIVDFKTHFYSASGNV